MFTILKGGGAEVEPYMNIAINDDTFTYQLQKIQLPIHNFVQ